MSDEAAQNAPRRSPVEAARFDRNRNIEALA
jgi:hypothetical protein